ncbi:MAG: DUF5058 family protein [Clostridia bacterium]|nr:DUF5058 family protein [Clostridia bacterium]
MDLSLLNSPVMYIFFMIRAYRAGKAIGMDVSKMRRTIISSATFTVLPSVGILLGVIALSGSLGTPLPWLRLSVIGALHYETQVAEGAAEAIGLSGLHLSEMTPEAFTTIALIMSFCIMWGMILSIILTKTYLKKLKKKPKNIENEESANVEGEVKAEPKKNGGFGNLAMTAMFVGLVSAYIGSYVGGFVSTGGLFTFKGSWLSIAVATIAALVMALFIWLSEKKKATWVESFSIAGSMIVAMGLSILLNTIVG